MEVEDDAPYLDLEGPSELQAYALIKDCKFIHMPAYDLDSSRRQVCVDTKF
jgi:hypothetical protein